MITTENKLRGGSETSLSRPLIQFAPDKKPYATVCSWCYPGSSVLTYFPAMRGLQISHSICGFHEVNPNKIKR